MSLLHVIGDPILAYIDAGSGSIILQALVGGAMAIGLVAKMYWRKLRGLFQQREG